VERGEIDPGFSGRCAVTVEPFLTAYDPSDLPGGSIDPLGFEGGYLRIAEILLPGMTNVAEFPRYFEILCAGAHLAELDGAEPPTHQRRIRQEAIMRLERLWALANVFAFSGKESRTLSGLRGVTFAQRQAALLLGQGLASAGTDYKLLASQARYGVIGIYSAVAENVKLIYRKNLELTPGLGEPLAEAFLQATQLPPAIRRAVKGGGDVSIRLLASWGDRAHLHGEYSLGEAQHFYEMLHLDQNRSRFANTLEDWPRLAGEDEQSRLQRIASRLEGDAENFDLLEAVTLAIRYEACYRLAQLVLERLIYLCRSRTNSTGTVALNEIDGDAVIQLAMDRLPRTTRRLAKHMVECKADRIKGGLSQLSNVVEFLEGAASACTSPSALAQEVLRRHKDIQHGKFDSGRRKMPWVQLDDGKLSLTLGRVGGLDFEPLDPLDIRPHPYRLASADRWIQAARAR
jgi:hypothetical protein